MLNLWLRLRCDLKRVKRCNGLQQWKRQSPQPASARQVISVSGTVFLTAQRGTVWLWQDAETQDLSISRLPITSPSTNHRYRQQRFSWGKITTAFPPFPFPFSLSFPPSLPLAPSPFLPSFSLSLPFLFPLFPSRRFVFLFFTFISSPPKSSQEVWGELLAPPARSGA